MIVLLAAGPRDGRQLLGPQRLVAAAGRLVEAPNLGQRGPADLAVVPVVSTALFWVVELQKLIRGRRPDPGSRLMTDARPQDVADHLRPDKGVVR